MKNKVFWVIFASLVGLFCIVFGYLYFSGKLYSSADVVSSPITVRMQIKVGTAAPSALTGRMLDIIEWQEVSRPGDNGKTQVWQTSLMDGASSNRYVQGDLDASVNGTIVFRNSEDMYGKFYQVAVIDPVLGQAMQKKWCGNNYTFIYPPRTTSANLVIRCTCDPYVASTQPTGCKTSPTATVTPTRTATATETRTATRTPTATPQRANAKINFDATAAGNKPSKVKASKIDSFGTNPIIEALVDSSWNANFSALLTGRYKFYVCDGGPANQVLAGPCTANNNKGSKTINVLFGQLNNNATISYGVWQ